LPPSRSATPAPAKTPRNFGAADWLVVIAGIAVVALHVVGARPPQGALWGADAYAFLPRWALVLAFAICTAPLPTFLYLWRFTREPDAQRPPLSVPRRVALWAAVLLDVMALFWCLREAHTFLGDGYPLTHDIPRGLRFHPHEPLSVFAHHLLFAAATRLHIFGTRDLIEVARAAIAAGSVVAGVVFVAVAIALARQLARLHATTPPAGRVTVALLAALLLGQGYVQLCFGYVENYTFVLVTLAAYLLVALRAFADEGSVVLPAALLGLAMLFDLSAAIVAPSLVVLLAVRARRSPLAVGLAVAALFGVLALGQVAIARLHPGYSILHSLLEVTNTAASGHGEGGRWAYLVSPQHALDLVNEHTLIGPFATLVFLAGVFVALRRPRRVGARGWFMVAAGLPALGAMLLTGDLNLGYPRDWDLFAPFALVFLVAGLTIVIEALGASNIKRALALAVLLSLFHTVPWIAVNASFPRSFERLKTLPLGYGRTETVVGNWYREHGDTREAKQWFARAIAVNPMNNAAEHYLGDIAIEEHDLAGGIRHYRRAAELRPDKISYHRDVMDLYAIAGETSLALEQAKQIEARGGASPALTGCVAILMTGENRHATADSLLGSAAASGADTLLASLRERVRAGDPYSALLQRFWNDLIARDVKMY